MLGEGAELSWARPELEGVSWVEERAEGRVKGVVVTGLKQAKVKGRSMAGQR